MKGRVGFIRIVCILEMVGVIFHDAFEEMEIVKVDGAAKADRDVDPNIEGSTAVC